MPLEPWAPGCTVSTNTPRALPHAKLLPRLSPASAALTGGKRLPALRRISSHTAGGGRQRVISPAYADPSSYHLKLGCPPSPFRLSFRLRRTSSGDGFRSRVLRWWLSTARPLGNRLLDQGRDGRELVSGRASALARTHRGRRSARGGRIIDVGGGASVLVDRLLDLPFGKIAVLDISEAALGKAKARLGERAERVRWVVADVTEAPKPRDLRCLARPGRVPLPDRPGRPEELRRARPEDGARRGAPLIATFADDGPKRCSDLDVCRYNARSLASELGEGFSLVREARETHTTPWGSSQAFFYGVFRRQ